MKKERKKVRVHLWQKNGVPMKSVVSGERQTEKYEKKDK